MTLKSAATVLALWAAVTVASLAVTVASVGAGAEPAARASDFGPFGTKWHPVVASVTARPEADAPTPAKSRAHTPAGVASAAHPFRGAYDIYRLVLTEIDGPRCAHRPTCSRYGWLAVSRHGVFVGVWLALDRLFRADRSSALRRLDEVRIDGVRYLLDPLEDSDFWLRRKGGPSR